MTALYIIGGIILFFIIVLSVSLSAEIEYNEKITVSAKWLFLKIPVYDSTKPKKKKEKKNNKDNKDKTDAQTKTENEASADVNAETELKNTNAETEANADTNTTVTDNKKKQPKKKKEKKPGNGLFKQLYLDLGYDGIEKMLFALGNSLNSFFGKLYKTVTVDELYLEMLVTGGDSAATALSYGKLCARVYPVLGKLVSTCKVKKYNVNIYPDFLAKEKKAALYTKIHVTPLTVLNGGIVLAVQLFFKVLIKILFSNSKSKKSRQQPVKAEAPVGESKTADVNK